MARFQASGHPAQKEKTKEGPTCFPVRTSPSFILESGSLPVREISKEDGDTKGQSALSTSQDQRGESAQGHQGSGDRDSSSERGWCLLGLNILVIL